jgi:predicted XRE-type DNA-binding protein
MRTGGRTTKGSSETKKTAIPIERGSGNVFEDLGLPDAAALLAKAELVSRICDIISKRGLTQSQAAKILGVSQPKISALTRGDLDGFSTDRLFRFLNALGKDVEISVKPRARSSKRPAIRVVSEKLAG